MAAGRRTRTRPAPNRKEDTAGAAGTAGTAGTAGAKPPPPLPVDVDAACTRRAEARAAHAARVAAWADASLYDSLDEDTAVNDDALNTAVDDSDVEEAYAAPLAERLEAKLGRNGTPGNVIKISVSP